MMRKSATRLWAARSCVLLAVAFAAGWLCPPASSWVGTGGVGVSPRGGRRQSAAVRVSDSERLGGGEDRRQLLLVDDEEGLRKAVGSFLELRGYLVATKAGGKDALQWLETRGERDLPDVIITDVSMPEMDGYQFLMQLRSRADLSSIPVLFLTARGMTDDRIQGYRAGVNAYLPKPFDPEELVSIVDNLISLGERTRALAMEEARSREKELELEDKRRAAALAERELLCARADALNDTLREVRRSVALTQREEQVLELLCRGRTNKEIAEHFDSGVRAVEKHVTNLLSKTGAKNRTELVQFAFQGGLSSDRSSENIR